MSSQLLQYTCIDARAGKLTDKRSSASVTRAAPEASIDVELGDNGLERVGCEVAAFLAREQHCTSIMVMTQIFSDGCPEFAVEPDNARAIALGLIG